MRRIGKEEELWLIENYAKGTIHDTLDSFEKRFGYRPTDRTIYMRAHKLGLRKALQDPSIRTAKAQVRIVWSKEPEMESWMLDHDKSGMEDTISAFEDEFGIRLSRGQISQFRSSHGTQQRDKDIPRRGGRKRRPIGFERKTKDGILVKVAEEATVPQSRDNWRFKHHIAYEKAYGKIPEGCQVMAVDGDTCNCDPENLVACPKIAIGALYSMVTEGGRWSDRDSLIAMINIATLRVGINDAEHRAERTCEVCGCTFVEPEDRRRYNTRAKTCPECLALGKKARGNRCNGETGICEKCGVEYPKNTRRQRLCHECSTVHRKKAS